MRDLEKVDLNTLSFEELIVLVNELKGKGLSLTQIEKDYGVRLKYISDKIRANKYELDKSINKYVPKDTISCSEVTPSNGVTQSKDIELKHQIVTQGNGITQPIKTEPKHEVVTPSNGVFDVEEIDILHKIIQEYKVRQLIQSDSEEDKGKTINRNIRVYEKQFDIFATWCKENNCTQADALYTAIKLLMKEYK